MSIIVEGTYSSTSNRTAWSNVPDVVVPSGSAVVMYIFIAHKQQNNNAGKFVSKIHWDGGGFNQRFTLIGKKEVSKSICEIWKLVNPTVQTADAVIDWGGDDSANRNGAVHAVVVLSGVERDYNFSSSGGGGSTSPLSITTKTGDLCYAMVECGVTLTENGDGTQQWNKNSSGSSRGAGVSFIATDTQVDFSFSHSGQTWSMAGLSIKERSSPNPILLTMKGHMNVLKEAKHMKKLMIITERKY